MCLLGRAAENSTHNNRTQLEDTTNGDLTEAGCTDDAPGEAVQEVRTAERRGVDAVAQAEREKRQMK